MKGALIIGLAASAGWLSPIGAMGALAPSPELVPHTVLVFDAELKQLQASNGQQEAWFSFWVTNICATNVAIFDVTTSCGCAVAQLPSLPWVVAPGESGPIKVTLDLRGRNGVLMKGVRIVTSAGIKELVTRVDFPAPASANPAAPGQTPRCARNPRAPLPGRQAILKGECAQCHAAPAAGTSGRLLYAAVCGVCHETAVLARRAPDLKQSCELDSAASLRRMIAFGRRGGTMPAWAVAEGGPLTEKQIHSLVSYLLTDFQHSGAWSNSIPSKTMKQNPGRPAAQPARPVVRRRE